MKTYECIRVDETLTQCLGYVESMTTSDFKLTNEQMVMYVVGITLLFTLVTVIKIIRRSFF